MHNHICFIYCFTVVGKLLHVILDLFLKDYHLRVWFTYSGTGGTIVTHVNGVLDNDEEYI